MEEEKIDHSEPVNVRCPSIPAWQERLLDERDELLRRTTAIRNAFDDPEMKLNEQEWHLLHRQYEPMRKYLQALTDRCVYYKLIKDEDLGLYKDTLWCSD